LARRPDVRAAGLDLQAADWRFAAARADRLPSLRLTASASYGADSWALLFDNWAATLAGSLTGPIFDAGRRKAEVERTRAVAGESLARYQERVLVSVKEVENALLQETKQGEYIGALKRALEAVRASYEQAQQRYRKGLNDYLPVLSALTQLQVLERRLVIAEFDRLGDRVSLCLALGGSWMTDTLAATEESNPMPGTTQAGTE
jgi:outer membrane protein TolC